MNPQVFGKEHLIYVAVSLIVAFVVCFLSKRYAKTEKAKTFVVKLSGAILFVIICRCCAWLFCQKRSQFFGIRDSECVCKSGDCNFYVCNRGIL